MKVEDTDQFLLTGSLMDEVNHRAGRGDNIGKLYLIKASIFRDCMNILINDHLHNQHSHNLKKSMCMGIGQWP